MNLGDIVEVIEDVKKVVDVVEEIAEAVKPNEDKE